MSVNNPHDKFIKDVLSESSHAVASLQAIVPVEIAGLLDWQTLQTEPDSFGDEELRELFADETQEKRLCKPAVAIDFALAGCQAQEY